MILYYLGEPLALYGNVVILVSLLRMSELSEVCVRATLLVLRMSAYIKQYRKYRALVQDYQ